MYAIARTRTVRTVNGTLTVLSKVQDVDSVAAGNAQIAALYPNLYDRNKARLTVVHAGTIAANARLVARARGRKS